MKDDPDKGIGTAYSRKHLEPSANRRLADEKIVLKPDNTGT